MTDTNLDDQEIFETARKIESTESQRAFVQQACRADRSQQERVFRLLRAYQDGADFLETPPPGLSALAMLDETALKPGTQIGPYRLIREIGEGGMGLVYQAEQTEPVRRQVAIKIIKPGMDTRQVIARFTSERQVLALMDHPNIARVLDAGTTDDGRPFFVMELVLGIPITEYCEQANLTTRERLELLLPVCQAVQEAHQKGIIHRDLKPSNVLVAVNDGRPVPKVIDFGVAKAIGSPPTGATPLTEHGQLVGTPEYMSPEQTALNPLDIDTRSDVYALGILLYELLTGTTPLDRQRLRGAAWGDMLEMIRSHEMPRPSQRVSTLEGACAATIAEHRQVGPRRLSRLLRGELDWIVMKALEKDRNRRYDSARALAADIERYLHDEAVEASPPSLSYRFRKFAWHHRVAVSAAVLATSGLLTGLGIALWEAQHARDAQQVAEEALREAETAEAQLAARYRIAQEAVDTYLLRVAQDQRLEHPSFHALRQQLLEAALPYYDQLHQLSPTGEVSLAARADALTQLGRLHHELGRFDESRAVLEQAASQWDQLSAAHPQETRYSRRLADVLVHLADHYRVRGASAEMLVYEQQALAVREQLAASTADDDLLQLELAQSCTNVGVATPGDDGQALLEQAIQIWRELAERHPETPLYREYLSLGYHNLGQHVAVERAEDAIPLHEFGLKLRQQLAQERPSDRAAQLAWADSHSQLASTMELLGSRLVDARAHREEAIRILSALAEQYPHWPPIEARLAGAEDRLAHALHDLGELDTGLATSQAAVDRWKQLSEQFPEMVAYSVGLAIAQHELGALLVALDRADEGLPMLTHVRDRLQENLGRVGPHEQCSEMLRRVQTTLADTRKWLGQSERDSSDDDDQRFTPRTNQAAGEALPPSKFLAGLSSLSAHGLRAAGPTESLSRTETKEQPVKTQPPRLTQSNSRSRRPRPLSAESLEQRQLLTVSISVADTTMNEIGAASAFIAPGSGGLNRPTDMTIGPDGKLYVASAGNDSILRFDVATGQLLGTFVESWSGGLRDPQGLAFGPDGNLYVASFNNGAVDRLNPGAVYRYDGTTGASLGSYLSADTVGLDGPRDVAFGPDGHLYVTNYRGDSITRYAGPLAASPGSPLPAAGQAGANFVPPGSGGLEKPVQVVFGADERLYVSDRSKVLRFDQDSGEFIDSFGEQGLTGPRGMALDADGRLYVADGGRQTVARYDSSGAYRDDLLAPNANEMRPNGLAFDPTGNLLIASANTNAVVKYAGGVLVTLSQASPDPVSVVYSTDSGSAMSGTDFSQQSGIVTFASGQTSRRVLLATRDDVQVESTETFAIELSSATGEATIADGTGSVAILDDDSLRQLAIADSSATEGDRTAHYRGAFIQTVARGNFNGLTFGPDGNLYVAEGPGPKLAAIDRYDGSTGAFIDHFIAGDRIDGVRDKVFRDGFLYIGSEYTDEVLRFNATTGAFDGAFVSADPSVIEAPHGLTFGPDANGDAIPELYVTGRNSQNLVRYDGATGQPQLSFNTSGRGALSFPEGLTIGPDGTVYVASTGSHKIQKYNAITGAYLGSITSANLSGPKDVKFGPDGRLYVASSGNDRILRFNADGTYHDDYVPAGAGGMDNTYRLAFGPDGDLYVAALGTPQILRFGPENEAIFTLTLSTPSSLPVTASYSTTNATAASGSDYVASSGVVTFPPGITTTTVRVPILDDAETEVAETFRVNLSNAVGATIPTSEAIGAILDNDPFTKFYVVNDASTDRTYEYGEAGGAVADYALNSGNTAPRGTAATVEGTKVWVVDANKKVYAYDTNGGLLGSWTAGGLQANAQLEGIATDGTDVWLVDNQTDKVYRYLNAAGLTSGTANPASNFSLNSGNKNPKDVVTNGTHLWIVDDSSSDYVFKYTVSGTYLGKWKITTAGAKAPTGIAVDHANVANLWIVDSGTDRVYQYNDAAGLTSGNRSANSSFALAAGNTNPQGIADPGLGLTLISGDFDFDSVVGAADIDRLSEELRQADRSLRFDLTGDSRVDEADRDRLIREILRTDYGDANLDGLFNSVDMILGFLAGEYEDDLDGNSTWLEGDWNGDGDFTSSDLVKAFLTGRYEQPQASSGAMASAIDWLFNQDQPEKRHRPYVA